MRSSTRLLEAGASYSVANYHTHPMDTTNHDELDYPEFDFPEAPIAPSPRPRRRNNRSRPSGEQEFPTDPLLAQESEYQGADDRVSFDDPFAPTEAPAMPPIRTTSQMANEPIAHRRTTSQMANEPDSYSYDDAVNNGIPPRELPDPDPLRLESILQWPLAPSAVPNSNDDIVRARSVVPKAPEVEDGVVHPVSRANTPTDDGPDYELGWDDHGTKEGAVAGRKIVADWKAGKRPAGVSTTRGYRPIVGYVVSQAELDRLPEGTPYTTKHGKFGIKGAAPAVVTSEPNAALGPNAFTTPDTQYTREPSLDARPAEMERAPLTGDDYHRSGRRFGQAVGDYGRPMVSVYPQGNANELMNRFNTANTGNTSTDPRRVAEMLANKETIRGPSILTSVNDEEDYAKLPHGAVYMAPGGVGKKGTGTGYIDMRGQFQPLRYGAANAGGVIAGERPVSGGAVSDQARSEARRMVAGGYSVTEGYKIPGPDGRERSLTREQFTVVSTEEARRKLPLGTVYITPDGTMAIRGTGLVTLNPEGFLVASTVPDSNQPHPMLR